MVRERLIPPLVGILLATLAENRLLELFLFLAQGSTLDRSPVPRLKDFSDAGKLRYGERAIVYCEADDDADETKDQPPSEGKVEDGPGGEMVRSEMSKSRG